MAHNGIKGGYQSRFSSVVNTPVAPVEEPIDDLLLRDDLEEKFTEYSSNRFDERLYALPYNENQLILLVDGLQGGVARKSSERRICTFFDWLGVSSCLPTIDRLLITNMVGINIPNGVHVICGGDITVESIVPKEKELRLNLVLKRQGESTALSLAFSEEEDFRKWTEKFHRLKEVSSFVQTCCDLDTLPTVKLYDSLQLEDTSQLSFCNTELSGSYMDVIVRLLKEQYVNALPFHSFSLINTNADDSIQATLMELFAHSPFLEQLTLSQQFLTSKLLVHLAQALPKLRYLVELNLSDNLISDKSIDLLCTALASLVSLHSLDLSRNRLSETAAVELSKKVLTTATARWKSINLSFNAIGEAMPLILSKLLSIHSATLTCLKAAYCGLHDAAVDSLEKIISQCQSLRVLDIEGNSFDVDSLSRLIRALGQCKGRSITARLIGNFRLSNNDPVVDFKTCKAALSAIRDTQLISGVRMMKRLDSYSSSTPRQELLVKLVGPLLTASEGLDGDDAESLLSFLLDIDPDYFTVSQETHMSSDSVSSSKSRFIAAQFTESFCFPIIDSKLSSIQVHGKSSKVARNTDFLRLGVRSVSRMKTNHSDTGGYESFTLLPSSAGRAWPDGVVPIFAPELNALHEYKATFRMEDWVDQSSLDNLTAPRDSNLSAADILTAIEDSSLEAVFAAENIAREARLTDERLILAVRKLHHDDEITSAIAKFWEGMFGNIKFVSFAERQLLRSMGNPDAKVSTSAIEGLDHLFPAIRRRIEIYDAVYARDTDRITEAVTSLPVEQGARAMAVGLRLCADVNNIRSRFDQIRKMSSEADLSLVESFLLECGKIAYTGSEMFEAVDIRQRVAKKVKTADSTALIRNKAVLTNLMISRDMTGLTMKVDELNMLASTDDKLLASDEFQAAVSMLQEHEQIALLLQQAITSRDYDDLDEALARSSYFGLMFDDVPGCLELLKAISGNPAVIMEPILAGLRAGDVPLMEKGFDMVVSLGLTHDALDSVVCSKINAVKAKIQQEDSIRSKLIKVTLAIKNKFPVPAGEVLSLLRRSKELKFGKDKTMRPYYKALQNHARKYAGLQKQEEDIEAMLKANDILKLSKLLAGRGTGKLVVSLPSKFAQDQWMLKLQSVCSGKHASSAAGDRASGTHEDVVYKGSFEKAARADDGQIRGWRKRFFILGSVHLAYFSKAGGAKKGVMRVVKGGVRRMRENEVEGRPFCLEIEEGRDLTQVSPDLIEEARRKVRFAKIMEVERLLHRGIEIRSAKLLTKTLRFATDLAVLLDKNLMNDAKACLLKLRESNLRKEMYLALEYYPRTPVVGDLLETASRVGMSANLPSLGVVTKLFHLPEPYQELYRAICILRGHVTDDIFRTKLVSMLHALSKAQSSLQFHSINRHVAALSVAYLAKATRSRLIERGLAPSSVLQLFRKALQVLSSMRIEIEASDLTRLWITFTSNDQSFPLDFDVMSGIGSHGNASSSIAHLAGGSTTVTDLRSLLLEISQLDKLQHHFQILKFPLLRSSVEKKGLFRALSTFRRAAPKQVMQFTTDTLLKSLLKYNDKEALDAAIAIEFFTCVQVLMGDKQLSSLPRASRSQVAKGSPRTLSTLIRDVLVFARTASPGFVNELFFQLCKQLNDNPRSESELRGWNLMSLILHVATPTLDALPYISCFVEERTVNHYHGSHAGATSKSRILAAKYCHALLVKASGTNRDELEYDQEYAFGQLRAKNSWEALYSTVLTDQPYEVAVLLPMGDVVSVRLQYGELFCPHELLLRAAKQLFPHELLVAMKARHVLEEDFGDEGTFLNEIEQNFDKATDDPTPPTAAVSKQDRGDNVSIDSQDHTEVHDHAPHDSEEADLALLTEHAEIIFRGFKLGRLRDSYLDATGDAIDHLKVPLQARPSELINWQSDLQWELLMETLTAEHDPESVPYIGEWDLGRVLLLQRDVWDGNEELETEYAAYGEEFPDAEQVQRSAHRRQWLATMPSTGVNSNLLPNDFARVDLLFAEDIRLVNSRLAVLSSDSFHYLLALQLALSWLAVAHEHTHGGHSHEQEQLGLPLVNYTISTRSAVSCELLKKHHRRRSVAKHNHHYAGLHQGAAHATAASTVDGEDMLDEVEEDSVDSDAILRHAEERARLARSYAPRNEDDSSSDDDYQSDSDEEDEHQELSDDGRWKPAAIGIDQEMSADDLALLLQLLDQLGVNHNSNQDDERFTGESETTENKDAVRIERLWQLMSGFHSLVITPKDDDNDEEEDDKHKQNITYGPRLIYFLKRAYHEYLLTACPFYDQRYVDELHLASLEIDGAVRSEQEALAHLIAEIDPQPVLLAVTLFGVRLLGAADWSVLFSCSLWDLTAVNFEGADDKNNSPAQLELNVNGLRLLLSGDRVIDAVEMIESSVQEALQQGLFPLGCTRTAAEFVDRLQRSSTSAQSSGSSQQVLWVEELRSRCQRRHQRFLCHYSLLPVPPSPPDWLVRRHSLYFRAPARYICTFFFSEETVLIVFVVFSRRLLQAQEKDEEERRELELAKLVCYYL